MPGEIAVGANWRGHEKNIIHPERCKGCGYCINFCPKKALGFSEGTINAKGYSPVRQVNDKCVACGLCYQICPDYAFEIQQEERA